MANKAHLRGELEMIEQTRIGRLGLLFAVLAPAGYLGLLFAVAVHEVVGHGLAAWLVGGEFKGFGLAWDGMGWARIQGPAPSTWWSSFTIMAGGIVATTLFGILTLAACLLVGGRWLMLRLTLLVFAVHLLLEGLSYTFFGAVHPTGGGDLAAIRAMLAAEMWRWVLAAISGVAMIGVMLLVMGAMLQGIETWLAPDDDLSPQWRAGTHIGVLLALSGAWFILDWNQLMDGMARWPGLVATTINMACALFLWHYPMRRLHGRPDIRHVWIVMMLNWCLLLLMVTVIHLWWAEGVEFG